MRTVALGEVVDSIGGGTPAKSHPEYYGGAIPWVTPKDMKVSEIGDSQVRITEAGLANSSARLVPEGSVLVVVRSGVLKHTLPVALATAPVAVNQDIRALLPTPAIDSAFLAHLLRARSSTVLRWVRATTADNFQFSRLLDLEVPLPPLAEQRRIAHILDSAASLRLKRQRAIDHGRALADSLFPSTATTVDRVRLGEILDRIDSGKSPVCETRPAGEGEWGVLKLGAISSGEFRPDENKAMRADAAVDERHEVRVGDVLLTRKNTSDLVGASVYVRETRPRLLLPDLLFRLVLQRDAGFTASYLQAALARPKTRRAIARLAGGSAGSMPNISKQRLLTVEVDRPTLDVQRQFDARMERVRQLAQIQERHVATLGELFASLQHRAFAGEL